MKDGIVLSLCDRTTNMVKPWAENGYECYCVDLQHPNGITKNDNITLVGSNLLTYLPPRKDYKIAFAFTPCTNLCVSGGRWFKDKGISGLLDGLTLFNRAIEILEWTEAPYFAENPVGVISSYYRKPNYIFDPCDYAGYLTDEEVKTNDAYTKKTCLWTNDKFIMPYKKYIKPVGKNKIHHCPPLLDGITRGDFRSITPMGFAYAVYEANK